MTTRPLAHVLVLSAALFSAALCHALPVGGDEAAAVARNWVRYVEHHQGGWGESGSPRILSEDIFTRDGQTLGHLFGVAPRGYVLVSARRELSPITAYSETSHLPTRAGGGIFDMLDESLTDRIAAIRELEIADKSVLSEHPSWAHLALPVDAFEAWLAEKDSEWEGVGPLLTSAWEQGWPFNLHCPIGSGDQLTYVGCTSLAMAQVMRFHQWPMCGEGSVSFWWDGDVDCGTGSPGMTVEANFMVPHDWELMPDTMDWHTPEHQQEAVAEFCYHVSAAIRTDFSTCGSAASLSRASAALVSNFRYQYGCREYPRFRYTDANWFELIRDEIDGGFPTLYGSTIHSMVCDGWREAVGMQQIHINYGWGGDSDNWFALDAIETSLNPYAERMIAGIRPGGTIETPVPEFQVERDEHGAELKWELDSMDPATCFDVWRGSTEASRVCITQESFTGATHYVWLDTAAPASAINYWLEMIVADMPSIWIGPETLEGLTPKMRDLVVATAEPNPFNPKTTIGFDLPRDARVHAEIFDLAGRRVSILLDETCAAGPHRVVWNGRDAAGRHASSGRYLFRLSVDGRTSTTKLTLTR